MHRQFIALIIGSAMAVTSLNAAPVQARDRDDAALAIIGATAASDHNRRGHVTRGYGHQSRNHVLRHNRGYYAPRHNRGYYAPRHRSHRGHSYGTRHGYRPHRLPRHGYGGYGNRSRHHFGRSR